MIALRLATSVLANERVADAAVEKAARDLAAARAERDALTRRIAQYPDRDFGAEAAKIQASIDLAAAAEDRAKIAADAVAAQRQAVRPAGEADAAEALKEHFRQKRASLLIAWAEFEKCRDRMKAIGKEIIETSATLHAIVAASDAPPEQNVATRSVAGVCADLFRTFHPDQPGIQGGKINWPAPHAKDDFANAATWGGGMLGPDFIEQFI